MARKQQLGTIDFWGGRHVSLFDLAQDEQARKSIQEMRKFMAEYFGRKPHVKRVSIVSSEEADTESGT